MILISLLRIHSRNHSFGTKILLLLLYVVCQMRLCWREFPYLGIPLCCGKAYASVRRITRGTRAKGKLIAFCVLRPQMGFLGKSTNLHVIIANGFHNYTC